MHKFETLEQYISARPQPLCDIGHALAGLIAEALPDADATLWHGHPTWKLGRAPVCLVKAYTRHLTLGFWRGTGITDASGRLVPGGAQTMAAVKLRAVEEIDAEQFGDWMRQAGALERAASA